MAQGEPPYPDEAQALGYLLSEDPRLELRQQLFPARQIVLAVIFGSRGEVTIPITPAAARAFAADLAALADQYEAEGGGGQN
jgi:hypothetical protein